MQLKVCITFLPHHGRIINKTKNEEYPNVRSGRQGQTSYKYWLYYRLHYQVNLSSQLNSICNS